MELKQINFRLPEDLLQKLKYIAWHDRKSITDTYVEGITDQIKKFEKVNGAITEDQISKALKK